MLILSFPCILLPMGKESILLPVLELSSHPGSQHPPGKGQASPGLAERLSCHQDTAQVPQALWSSKPWKGWEQTVAA